MLLLALILERQEGLTLNGNELLTITNEMAQSLLTIPEIINCVEQTYSWYSQGKIVAPSKITTDIAKFNIPSWINAMPSYVEPSDTLGIKWAGGFTKNTQKGGPYIRATILVNDSRTGDLIALLEGEWISDIRTGAQTAVAAKYLSCTAPKVLTIIGAGIQGMATTLCLTEIFDFDEIRICDIRRRALDNFANKISSQVRCPIIKCESNAEAVTGADIIVTATAADTVLVKNEWVKAGALVSTIGSYQEIEEELVMAADKLIVDHLEQNLHRGEFFKLFQKGALTTTDIYAELGDIISGKKTGRDSVNERIVISPIGMGCLDISIAGMLLQKIAEKKINKDIS